MIEVYNGCPVNPYAIGSTNQQQQAISLNYTNQDFWSMKARLVQFCEQRFGPSGTVLPNSFNDFVESDLAIMLIENFAFIGDLLSFKIDQVVNELGIKTVTQLDNAFRLSELVGFQPVPPIAASSMWSATIPGQASVDIQIQTPVPVNLASNGIPITIELFASDANNEPLFNQPIIIPAGQIINQSIIGLEGQTVTSKFTGDGTIAQTYTLVSNPVIYGSIQVQVNGVAWQQVSAFTDSQPRQEYRVEYDSTWTAYVIFGNNQAGLIPSQGSQIVVQYRTGGGITGNIVTGYGNKQLMVAVAGLAYNVPVTFINYTKGQYGYDGDGIDDIRNKLPAWTATQNRCVSGSDYTTFANQFATPYHGQVGKATAVLRNQGCAGNIIDLYILANGTTSTGVSDLETASGNLKADLVTALSSVQMLTDFVCIKDGIVIPVDISITATLDILYKKYQNEVQQNILNIVNQFFALNNWDYGQSLRSIDLIKVLAGITQVDDFTISFTLPNSGSNTLLDVVTAKFYEIIRPDPNQSVNIIFI